MRRQWLSRTSRSRWPVVVLLTALVAALFLVPVSGAEGALSGERICLDPGHGGEDPGAVNEAPSLPESLLEKEINLDVSYALRALLQAQGAVVEMTRYDDRYLTNRDRYTFCNNWGADILISVHTNSVDNDTWDGATTLWSKREDKALAVAIHAKLYPYLRDTAPDPDSFVDFGLTKFQSGVLLKSDMPAAMMEPVFMSNAGEAARLGQSVYDQVAGAIREDCLLEPLCRRGQIMEAIYQGILNYYEPTPTPEPGGDMYVDTIEMSYIQNRANYSVITRVTVVGGSGEDTLTTVSGATVSLITSFPDGKTLSGTTTTDSEGVATFTVKSRTTGTYTSTVTDVSKPGWSYPEPTSPVSATVVVP